MLDSLTNNNLKPLFDLVDKRSPNNVANGYVTEILKDANSDIIGYKIKVGAETHNIYDASNTDIVVKDLVTVSVSRNGGFRLSSILSAIKYRVDLNVTTLGIDDG